MVVFDVFFRSIFDDGGYVIFVGLEFIIEYIKNLIFDKELIEFLRNKKIFDEGFLIYLENFKFIFDVYVIKEGILIFFNELLMVIKGFIIEC